MLFGLAEALAGDSPELRYAAAQVLRLRYKPLEYFREAQRLGKPRSANAAVVADNAPRNTSEGDTRPQKGWLRRLFNSLAGGARPAGQAADFPATGEAERAQLRRLAFGAYVGLLRQAAPGDDEGHRVRRDAVDRIVELATGGLGTQAAVPALLRALEDPHHLVRLAA